MDGGKAVVAAVAGGLLFFGARHAQADMSGNILLDRCKKVDALATPGVPMGPTGTLEAVSCANYIGGYVDGQDTLKKFDLTTVPYCLPENVPFSQLVKVFIKHAESNPARLHQSGSLLIAESLMVAFPCKK